MAYQSPVYEVFGMEDRKAGHCIKTGGCEIIIFSYAYCIGIGIVGIDDRVFVSAIAVVGYPYSGSCLGEGG
jgi:hypothetical protein